MFDYNGPVAATNEQRTFIAMHLGQIPEGARYRFLEILNAASPVDAVVRGMESLYAGISEIDGFPVAEALTPLGVVATAVAHGQYWGKAVRAFEIAAWAAYQINPIEGVAPPAPLPVDPAFTFLPPETIEPVPDEG